MKKLLQLALIVVLAITLFSGCTPDAEDPAGNGDEVQELETLIVYFVPSREPDEIITTTEPLKAMLKDELAKLGFNIGEVDIKVGTTYNAVGEALSAGSAHVGLIPGGTYVLYDDGADVILTATRAGLNKDSDNPADWNDGEPTLPVDEQVTYYRSLIVAGPSEKGQELLSKVNSGEELTLEDLQGAVWGVQGSTSSAGYIYPTIWVRDHFGVMLSDMNIVRMDSYGTAVNRLATSQVDLINIYADARRDYADRWVDELGLDSIWTDTGVIGVTSGIYNDTV